MFLDVLINLTLVISIIYFYYRAIYRFNKSFVEHDRTQAILLAILALVLAYIMIDVNGFGISMFFVPLLLISIFKHPVIFSLTLLGVFMMKWIEGIFYWEMIVIFIVAHAIALLADHFQNFSRFVNSTISHSLFIFIYFIGIYVAFEVISLSTVFIAIIISHIIAFLTTIILNDINFIAKLIKRYEQDEYTDQLTQLGNSKALDRDVERWIASKNHLTMYLIDIDGFSTYNENYGYRTGDAIIRQMVDALKNISPQGSLLFRNGGEEFTILIPELSFDKSVRLADGIRKNIENHLFYIDDDEQISLTVTIGIGYHSKSLETDKTTLFKDAGDMLHRAKKQGQNQIMFSPL